MDFFKNVILFGSFVRWRTMLAGKMYSRLGSSINLSEDSIQSLFFLCVTSQQFFYRIYMLVSGAIPRKLLQTIGGVRAKQIEQYIVHLVLHERPVMNMIPH